MSTVRIRSPAFKNNPCFGRGLFIEVVLTLTIHISQKPPTIHSLVVSEKKTTPPAMATPYHDDPLNQSIHPYQGILAIFSNPSPQAATKASISVSVIGVDIMAEQVLIMTNPASKR